MKAPKPSCLPPGCRVKWKVPGAGVAGVAACMVAEFQPGARRWSRFQTGLPHVEHQGDSLGDLEGQVIKVLDLVWISEWRGGGQRCPKQGKEPVGLEHHAFQTCPSLRPVPRSRTPQQEWLFRERELPCNQVEDAHNFWSRNPSTPVNSGASHVCQEWLRTLRRHYFINTKTENNPSAKSMDKHIR